MTRARLRSEQGVTMIAVMIVMLVATTIATAALLAAQQDLPFARASQDRKQAFAAAEAGVEYYLYQITQDNDYWTKCTGVPAPAPVNQKWDGVSARKWRNLTGSTAQYSIELLPNSSSTSCVAGSAHTTMLDPATGTFRVRVTGQTGKTSRTIVASFRRHSFLDFLYFTNFETLDPFAYTTPALQAWASGACGSGKYRAARDTNCQEIQFVSADANRGPFHTNDNILACGGYTLGRKKADRIEISGLPSYTNPGTNGSCNSGAPNMLGTLYASADQLIMPTTNAAIKDQAQPGYLFTGTTTIVLKDDKMDVTLSDGTQQLNKALPANGVIYVQGGACPSTSSPLLQNYDEAPGCANVIVSGSYSKNLTIASEKDVIVGPPLRSLTDKRPASSNGDLKKNGDVVLGLIANEFVRVEHSVSRTDPTDTDNCTNRLAPDGLAMEDVQIDAAILSLNHSFIADNFRCGARLGTITVNGAIAQKYRGPVGLVGSRGFIKDYNYDDRLRYRSPPYFLDPVSAAWGVVRENEQVPAVK